MYTLSPPSINSSRGTLLSLSTLMWGACRFREPHQGAEGGLLGRQFCHSKLLGNRGLRQLHRYGLQLLLPFPARPDQFAEKKLSQDYPLRIGQYPGLFLKKQGQERPLPCPFSENALRLPRYMDFFGLFQLTI